MQVSEFSHSSVKSEGHFPSLSLFSMLTSLQSSAASTLYEANAVETPKGQSLPKPVESYTLKKTIWRPYVTPFENILNHKYPGSGTEADPYIVDWLPHDPEDPQRWSTAYKWVTSE
jgi:hypothetical protein